MNARTFLQQHNAKLPLEDVERSIEEIIASRDVVPGERFHGYFFYEVRPLLLIAKHVGANALALMGKSSSFDGILYMGEHGIEQKVELTAAIDGHNDAMIMELLRRRGFAPAFQKIEYIGTKSNRVFGNNEIQAFEAGVYEQTVLIPLLQGAFDKKAEKARRNIDYADAWLGIVFDDHLLIDVEEKRTRFDPPCIQFLKRVQEHNAVFSRLFFVGSSMKYIIDSKDIS